MSLPAGTRGSASSGCEENGTEPVGGGGYASSSTLGVSMSASVVFGTAWVAIFNNSDPTATTIDEYTICAYAIDGENIVTAQAPDPARTHVHLAAVCPAGNVVLSGGAANSDTDGPNLGEQMVSSYPVKTGTGASATYSWAVDVNNTYKSREIDLTAFAVCAPAALTQQGVPIQGYHIAKAPAVLGAPLSQAFLNVLCNHGVPLGGGVKVAGTSLKVSLNSSDPNGGSWEAYVNNGLTKGVKMTPYAVCA